MGALQMVCGHGAERDRQGWMTKGKRQKVPSLSPPRNSTHQLPAPTTYLQAPFKALPLLEASLSAPGRLGTAKAEDYHLEIAVVGSRTVQWD